MENRQKHKIRKNYSHLLNDLHAGDITIKLFQRCVIEFDDMQRIEKETTDKDKTKRLVDILLTTRGSYKPFLEEIKSSRIDLYELLENTDVEEELNTEKIGNMQFLKELIERRFRFSSGEAVFEDDMLDVIGFEYWKSKRGDIPGDIQYSLIDIMPLEIPGGTVCRANIVQHGKMVWTYSNIELKPNKSQDFSSSNTDEDDSDISDYSDDSDDSYDSDDSDDSSISSIRVEKPLMELKTSDLQHLLAPYFEREGIDEKYLDVLDAQKIDGEVFALAFSEDCIDTIKELFPNILFGERIKIKKIAGLVLTEDSKNQKRIEKRQRLIERNKLRPFDTDAVMFYREDAVIRIRDIPGSDLIQPLHSFRHREDHDDFPLSDWIAMETAKFAGACLTDRRNGTIHFGISESSDAEGCEELEGKVIGLQINNPKFMEMFYEKIKQHFYKDQFDIVFRCLRPPQLVEVRSPATNNMGSLYVVEIDVVPAYDMTQSDTFYIREKNEKDESVSRIYTFLKNEPTILQKEDLKIYMQKKFRIAQKRKKKDYLRRKNNQYSEEADDDHDDLLTRSEGEASDDDDDDDANDFAMKSFSVKQPLIVH